jgi:hypothetical protein
MLEEASSASSAAFAVGCESASRFTCDHARLFQAPPKRDTLRLRRHPAGAVEREAAAGAVVLRGRREKPEAPIRSA